MTNAETILVPPDMYNSNGSNLYDIGFTFVFMGKAYNKFSVSPWGILKLGYNKVGSNIGYNFSFNLQVPLLAPFWNDLNSVSNQSTTGTTRIIKKLEGVEPYRILTVQWKDFVIDWSAQTTTKTCNFQVRLYETTNVIEFIYGTMQIATNSSEVWASIGFSDTTLNNRLIAVTNLLNPQVTTLLANAMYPLVIPNVGFINGLHSSNDSSRVIYKFTPNDIIPLAPINLSFSIVTYNSMRLNWVDVANNETGYAILISYDGGISYHVAQNLPTNSTSADISGLKHNCTYYFKVVALTEGRMSAPLEGSNSTLQAAYSGRFYVGNGLRTPHFSSITEAISKINQFGINGPIEILIQEGYSSNSESFPIVFTKISGLNSTNFITIKPAPEVNNLVISANFATSVIDFNGAEFIVIDGRSSDTSLTRKLTVINENSSGSTIRFFNSACHNILRFCRILGANNSNDQGVIFFGSSPANSRGNSYNIVEHCQIGNSINTPRHGIVSQGANSFNLYNEIRNCEI